LANGAVDATPPAQTVTGSVTGAASGTLYITIVGSGPAIASISAVTITSNTTGQSFVSVPSPASLGIGTYTGTINVSACLNDPQCATGKLGGSPQTVNVTYKLAGVKTSASTRLSCFALYPYTSTHNTCRPRTSAVRTGESAESIQYRLKPTCRAARDPST
jgi:hypothetical protein